MFTVVGEGGVVRSRKIPRRGLLAGMKEDAVVRGGFKDGADAGGDFVGEFIILAEEFAHFIEEVVDGVGLSERSRG